MSAFGSWSSHPQIVTYAYNTTLSLVSDERLWARAIHLVPCDCKCHVPLRRQSFQEHLPVVPFLLQFRTPNMPVSTWITSKVLLSHMVRASSISRRPYAWDLTGPTRQTHRQHLLPHCPTGKQGTLHRVNHQPRAFSYDRGLESVPRLQLILEKPILSGGTRRKCP